MRRAVPAVLMTVAVVTGAVLTVAACSSPSTRTADPGPAASARSGGADTGSPDAPQPQETNPPGDIPDNTAFVAFRPPSGQYEIKVPEGWARTASGNAYTFTDKLNTVRVETVPASTAPTPDSAKATEVPAIQAGARRFALQKVETVQRPGGRAVLIGYRAESPVDPVTGKVVPDAFERYEFFRAGTEAVVTLSGPVNADNVDPWRMVTDSFRWLG
jgi:hypothetical protein